ncbi:MAG: TetR family transcriptional regulator [Myxococcota bacterium]|nr:TetR family transcriptional regulator [Myxococcales bacterium]
MSKGRPKTFDEVDALDRAMETFWLHGYEATSLSLLVGEMGISRQSLYDTYGNKRQLFLRAIDHYRATRLVEGLDLLERPGSPVENVKALIHFFEAIAGDERCRGCFVANTLVELGPHDAEVAAVLHGILSALEGAIAASLEEARRTGELAPGKDPQELASALLNAIIGIAVTGKLARNRYSLPRILAGTLRMLD